MQPSKHGNFKKGLLGGFLKKESAAVLAVGNDNLELSQAHRLSHHSNAALKYWFENLFALHEDFFSKFAQGETLELGSGGSDLKKYKPLLVTSDVLPLVGVDRVIDAQNMALKNCSIGNISMINVLHHIPKPLKFFSEADRVLANGGRIVFTEPYISYLSYPIYRYFHHEPCDLHSHILELEDGSDALFDSNQAMPTQLVRKFRRQVYQAAPELKIVKIKYHSALSYFLTGGVNYKTPLPYWVWRTLYVADNLLCLLFGPLIASFFTVVLEKKDT